MTRDKRQVRDDKFNVNIENMITLLYVDDEPMNVMLFELNFKKKYNVFTALSGSQGLEILKSNRSISVVVSDMRMPGLSGVDFIRIAKNDYPQIVFFILTGFEITEEISSALTNNLINKYLRKPFNFFEIEKAINDAINYPVK